MSDKHKVKGLWRRVQGLIVKSFFLEPCAISLFILKIYPPEMVCLQFDENCIKIVFY